MHAYHLLAMIEPLINGSAGWASSGPYTPESKVAG